MCGEEKRRKNGERERERKREKGEKHRKRRRERYIERNNVGNAL